MSTERLREILARELCRQDYLASATIINPTNAFINAQVDREWKNFLPKALGLAGAIDLEMKAIVDARVINQCHSAYMVEKLQQLCAEMEQVKQLLKKRKSV